MLITELPCFIETNLTEDLSIKTLSRKCYMCTTLFKETFKEVYGESIGKYIIKRRMYAAARLLTSGKMVSVKQVKKVVGYTSGGNFAKTFNQFYGYPPKDVFIPK